MARTPDKDRVSTWQRRVESAGKAYTDWEEKYRCETSEEYYYGHQWAYNEEGDEQKYVINMVFPTVEVKIPSLLFNRPKMVVRPRPARSDDPGSTLGDRAKLQTDTLNTLIADPHLGFRPETQLSLKEAMWRFGVVEVGYSVTDYVDNPNLDKPELSEPEDGTAGEPLKDRDGNEVVDTREILIKGEAVYLRRIPAKQFRVPVSSKNILGQNDWCGYFDWHYLDDLKRNKKYKNRAALRATGSLHKDLSPFTGHSEDQLERDRSMVKVWKIWDLRAKVRYVWPDGHDKFLLDAEPFKRHPFEVLKFHERADDFYPVPPIFNWLSPQDELNETREMQRVHRRRFYRRYAVSPQADEKEVEKLEHGGDGVYARINPTDIAPIADAPLDAAVARNIPQTKEDLREISAVGAEQRGEADPNVTATQANIVEARSQIRENFHRFLVSEWLAAIGAKVLWTLIDNFTLPFWITSSVDPRSPAAPMEAARVMELWQQITAKDIAGPEFDVTVDIESLSPMSEQADKQNFFTAITTLANPAVAPLLLGSPTLLKRVLGYFNIRGSQEIEEITGAMAAVVQMQVMQAQMAGGPKGSSGVGGPQGPPTAGPTPSPEATGQQLEQQMGVVQ